MFNLNIQNYFGNSSIAPDVSYCYNFSIDFLEITIGDLNYFLKETNFDLTLLFDDCEQNNLNFIKTLDNFFIKWYEEIANEKQKSYVFYKFLFNLEYQLDIFNKELFQFYNDGIIDKRLSYKKLLENINSENINKNSKINKNIDKYIEKTTLQNLWNNLYGENENENKIKRLFSFYELVLNKINNYSKNVFHTLDSLMKEEYLINFNKSNKIIDNLRTSEIVNEIEISNNLNKNIFKKKIEKRKVFKEAKKMLFNSIKTLSSFIGKDKTNSFIKGDSFFINGKSFNYKVFKKNKSFLQEQKDTFNINIPYNLELYDLNNEYLASLCITFQGCPILDQVLSLYLMIQNNQEKEILKNSNFYKVSSLFKKEYSYLIDEKNSFSISNFIDNEENLNQEFEYKFKNNLKFKNYLNKNIYNKTLPIEIFKTIFEKDVSWDEAIDYYAFNFSNPSLDYFVKNHNLKENYIIC